MSTKSFVWLFLFIGSILGGYLPTIFGASMLSISSLFWSSIGSLIGIWIGFKVAKIVNGQI